MSEQMVKADVIARMFGVTVRRVQQLTQDGIIHTTKPDGGGVRQYELETTVHDYIKYLSDKANGREHSDKKADLESQKLKAEIALKESQGELHRIKTAIASGKYIPVEEVKLDYDRFFVQLKKFLLAVPNRVAGQISGYAEPVIVRGVEKDLSTEITSMLSSFIVAGQADEEVTEGYGEKI